jgi:hypothetical protein
VLAVRPARANHSRELRRDLAGGLAKGDKRSDRQQLVGRQALFVVNLEPKEMAGEVTLMLIASAPASSARLVLSRRFEQALEECQIVPVRAAHGAADERCHQPGESGRDSVIPQCHPRATVWSRIPCVDRLHRKRSLSGPHHQSLTGSMVHDLVGVRQLTTQEVRDERDARALSATTSSQVLRSSLLGMMTLNTHVNS